MRRPLVACSFSVLLSAIISSSAASTPDLTFTDWQSAASLAISTPPGGVPYVEKAEFGAPLPLSSSYNHFGNPVAAWQDSASGTTWVVAGAYTEDGQSAAYVFSRVSELAPWHQEARLVPSDGMDYDGFGQAVAIESATIVIGAPGHGSGTIYTFDRDSSGTWQQRDEASLGGVTRFGETVELSGGTLAVSAPNTDSGHVFIYTRSRVGPGWSILGSLSPPDHPTGASFGKSVSIDGGRILIGAPDDSTVAHDQGSAYFFDGGPSSWTFRRKIASFPDGGPNDGFGAPVILRGNAALIGIRGRNSYTGAVDAFALNTAGDWVEQTVLQAPAAEPGDNFGYSLAMLGTTVAVGAYGRDNYAGAIYLFDGSPSGWTPLATLTSPESPLLGLLLTSAGNDFIAGLPDVLVDPADRGRIDVFANDSGDWHFSQSIIASADDQELFGSSVGIANDTVLITAPDRLNFDKSYGATEIYGKNALGNWNWQAELQHLGSVPDQLLAVDGDTAVIGAPDQNFGSNVDQGAAYVFEHVRSPSGDSWVQQATFADLSGIDDDRMGASVAIDRDTIAVGATRYGRNGVVYIYTKTGSVWNLQAKFSPAEGTTSDGFGSAVALRGNVLLVGASLADSKAGAAYVFQRSGSSWSEKKRLLAPDRMSSDRFGQTVALSAREAIVSAPYKQIGTYGEVGRVYSFDTTVWTNDATFDSPAPGNSYYFGSALALSGNRFAIGEPGSNSAYLFARSAAGWTLQSTLTGNWDSSFGTSMWISGSSLLVGAPYEVPFASGRAYLFEDDRIFADGYQ